jgi:hypothetical protein
MTIEELCASIAANRSPFFATQLAEWASDSLRFRVFAEQYRDKLRKKLRGMRDDEGVRDLLAELEAAHVLLRDRRFTLEYEPYIAEKQRGPDFRATFRTHTLFTVEVTRMRSAAHNKRDLYGRIADEVCEKLRQMLPGISNVLYLRASDEPNAKLAKLDLNDAMAQLFAIYKRKDEAFFTRRGLDGSADFLRRYHRLSGILIRPAVASTPPLWLNALAKHPLSSELRQALLAV